MGLTDVFGKEDRCEITISQLWSLIKEASKADLMMNGIKNRIDYESIYMIMTGDHVPETESEDK